MEEENSPCNKETESRNINEIGKSIPCEFQHEQKVDLKLSNFKNSTLLNKPCNAFDELPLQNEIFKTVCEAQQIIWNKKKRPILKPAKVKSKHKHFLNKICINNKSTKSLTVNKFLEIEINDTIRITNGCINKTNKMIITTTPKYSSNQPSYPSSPLHLPTSRPSVPLEKNNKEMLIDKNDNIEKLNRLSDHQFERKITKRNKTKNNLHLKKKRKSEVNALRITKGFDLKEMATNFVPVSSAFCSKNSLTTYIKNVSGKKIGGVKGITKGVLIDLDSKCSS